ncbi:hypothetical protein C2L66_38955 [Paraburkholderia caribensis]|nr:hypothetical protein C2L66_38955 [Paraburkholderia caribensis]
MNLRLAFCFAAVAAGLGMTSLARAEDYKITVGGGFDVAPRYLGSDEYHFIPVPYLNVVTSSGVYVDTDRGVGYKLHLPHNFYLDMNLNYVAGRKDTDETFQSGSDALRGLGNTPSALDATVTAGYRFATVGSLSVAADLPLSNRSIGDAWQAALEVPVLVAGPNVVTSKTVAHFGSQTYNQTMWGVNATQSAASGYRQYAVGSGFDSVDFDLIWLHRFNQHWSLETKGGLTRIIGDAAHSPIVQRSLSLNVGTVMGYSF